MWNIQCWIKGDSNVFLFYSLLHKGNTRRNDMLRGFFLRKYRFFCSLSFIVHAYECNAWCLASRTHLKVNWPKLIIKYFPYFVNLSQNCLRYDQTHTWTPAIHPRNMNISAGFFYFFFLSIVAFQTKKLFTLWNRLIYYISWNSYRWWMNTD